MARDPHVPVRPGIGAPRPTDQDCARRFGLAIWKMHGCGQRRGLLERQLIRHVEHQFVWTEHLCGHRLLRSQSDFSSVSIALRSRRVEVRRRWRTPARQWHQAHGQRAVPQLTAPAGVGERPTTPVRCCSGTSPSTSIARPKSVRRCRKAGKRAPPDLRQLWRGRVSRAGVEHAADGVEVPVGNGLDRPVRRSDGAGPCGDKLPARQRGRWFSQNFSRRPLPIAGRSNAQTRKPRSAYPVCSVGAGS